STRTVPALGSSSRLTRRSSEVLPAPDGPTMARNSRSLTASDTASSVGAWPSPKALVTFSKEMAVACVMDRIKAGSEPIDPMIFPRPDLHAEVPMPKSPCRSPGNARRVNNPCYLNPFHNHRRRRPLRANSEPGHNDTLGFATPPAPASLQAQRGNGEGFMPAAVGAGNAQANAPAVALSDVTIDFRLPGRGTYTAVADASLRVADGEFVAIVGPTGCGKSTLLNVAA